MVLRVFLIGFMGCGKTTLGRLLATRLDWQWIDLDKYIEQRHCRTIDWLLMQLGEAKFREIEHAALVEVSDFENVVISCGGGTPCFFDNMQLMCSQGRTIYLQVEPSVLVERLKNASVQRPLITCSNSIDLQQQVEQLLIRRESFYTKADMVVQGDDEDKERIVQRMIDELHKIQPS